MNFEQSSSMSIKLWENDTKITTSKDEDKPKHKFLKLTEAERQALQKFHRQTGYDQLLALGNHDDLLVFGYGCKIFRDDERAKSIDEQKHLIPWMGNRDLLIDRYDCRGALTDVSKYEPGSCVADDEGSGPPDQEGEDFEAMLDEERYRDLNEDEDYDEGAYTRELEYKKLESEMGGVFSMGQGTSRSYATFQYSYNEQNPEVRMGPEPKRLHDEDSPYVKPVGLYVPEEITLPKTMKVHAIIEKTAKFIASQGNQMEILLKTKQAANPQFEFLNHDGVLNSYYKFMVHAIRAGIYRPKEQDPGDDEDDVPSSSGDPLKLGDEDSDNMYLHPSLLGTASAPSIPSMDTAVTYTGGPSSSSKHNAYSMLVSKIKGTDSPDPTFQQSTLAKSYSSAGDGGSSTSYSYGYKSGSSSGEAAQSQEAPARPKKELPSSQDQLIIEKMASYVIKNGSSFENAAKGKADPRFGFLDPSHKFHWYYLNCKERFKAECNAVVASSDFVNYSGSAGSSKTPGIAGTSAVSVKKSAVVAELAEMRKKSTISLIKKEATKEKSSVGASSNIDVDDVFSRAKLVNAKEKDKPVIRFATTLGLVTNNPSPLSTGMDGNRKAETLVEKKSEASSWKESEKVEPVIVDLRSDNDEKEEGEIDSDLEAENAEDDPFEDADLKFGNSSANEDEQEKVKRRMERKRKAALFLQNLKISKQNTPANEVVPSTGLISSSVITTGTSLGDLLSQRLKAAEGNSERESACDFANNRLPVSHKWSHEDNLNGGMARRSSSSTEYQPRRSRSRSYVRSPSRSQKKKRKQRSRTRSRSYSSSVSSGNSSDSSHYSRKKSKKKHRKKKKKHEKSSRSSHKSKKR